MRCELLMRAVVHGNNLSNGIGAGQPRKTEGAIADVDPVIKSVIIRLRITISNRLIAAIGNRAADGHLILPQVAGEFAQIDELIVLQRIVY